MRRDGLLRGYVWNKARLEKVKVKPKASNASKSSGRCPRSKCSLCHDWPVSKARSKSKGCNKRTWSRALVDDQWALCKCSSRTNPDLSGLCRVYCGGFMYAYDALDPCCADVGSLEYDDFDIDAYLRDTKPPRRRRGKGNVVSVHGAARAIVADDVSDPVTHACDDVKDVGAPFHGDKVGSAQVFGSKLGELYTPDPAMHAQELKITAPDMDHTGIHATAARTVVVNVADNASISATISHVGNNVSHVGNDVSKDDEGSANDSNIDVENHDAIIVHAADDTSSGDDANADADADYLDYESDVAGILRWAAALMDRQRRLGNDNEVSEVESEVDSLNDDWCYVADFPDIGDDWYLC